MKVSFVGLDRQYSYLRGELINEFDRIGKSGVYILGQTLSKFEGEAAKFCGVKYAIGVGNGSDALVLILKALGVGPGDEVITCPNSFIATAWVINAVGAKPIFVDSSEDYNIDAQKISKAINLKTKAIIPVHLTGMPADMTEINKIASEYGLAVIEDAAQAIGATYQNKRVGSLGDAAGFSLHPLKNLGVYGDGGFITTDRMDIYEKINILRNHGLRTRDECELWGINSRLDELQAGFALIKMKYLEGWNNKCREIANKYRNSLRNFVWVPEEQEHKISANHNFVIQTDRRDELMLFLNANGVGTRIHYPLPLHLQDAVHECGYSVGDFPVVEKQAKSILSLPIYPELTDEEVDYVIQCVKKYFK